MVCVVYNENLCISLGVIFCRCVNSVKGILVTRLNIRGGSMDNHIGIDPYGCIWLRCED